MFEKKFMGRSTDGLLAGLHAHEIFQCFVSQEPDPIVGDNLDRVGDHSAVESLNAFFCSDLRDRVQHAGVIGALHLHAATDGVKRETNALGEETSCCAATQHPQGVVSHIFLRDTCVVENGGRSDKLKGKQHKGEGCGKVSTPRQGKRLT